MDCRSCQQLVERAYVGHNPKHLDRARDHIRSCADCQQFHRRLFEAAALVEGEALLGSSEQAMLASRVLDGEGRRASRRWLPMASAAAAAATVLLAVLWLRVPDGQEFRARGSSESSDLTATRRADAPVSLRALCLIQQGDALDVEPLRLPSQPGAAPSCGQHDRLGFAVLNGTEETWHLTLVLLNQRQSQVLVAGEVKPSKADQPVDKAASLAQMGPGEVAIYGIFSRARLATAHALRLVRELGRARHAVRTGMHLVRLDAFIGD